MNSTRKPGVLVLIDPNHPEGKVFPGKLFGADVDANSLKENPDRGHGEVVFNTGMTGYQEILTDPSYFGEMVCMTYPHIGNTGINSEDVESQAPRCAGFIIHDLTEEPSNWRTTGGLEDYLKEHQIPGIMGIDTRALTLHLRSSGVTRGVILPAHQVDQAPALLKGLPHFEGRDLIREVSTPKSYVWPGSDRNAKCKVAVLDFGVKWNLLRSLASLGCELEVFPADTPAETLLASNPDGIFLSNGPGDPAAATYAHESVREILGKKPLFGVCMGHQILALALKGKTFKLKFGHRGANQPVFDRKNDKVAITSQNHGYAVDPDSLPSQAQVTHINLNDKTCAGLEVPHAKAFSVQYHPEASPGPHDSFGLFRQFVDMIDEARG